MTKKKAIISLIIILVLGSFITFYGGNLFSSDISNMFHDLYLVSSFPFLCICFDAVLAIMFIIRFYRYQKYKKAILNLYTIILGGISLFGVITTILSGILYKSFIKPYPFPGYLLIMLILNLLLLAAAIYMNIMIRKNLPDDLEKRNLKVKYAIYSAVLPVLLFMAMYRFGSVLWMPVYVQTRTFYMTFVFYLWNMVPMALVLHILAYYLDVYKNYKQAIIYLEAMLTCHVVLGIIVVIIGTKNPVFISAISPALPLERLATAPVDTIIQMVSILAFGLYYCIYSIISYQREEKKAKEIKLNK